VLVHLSTGSPGEARDLEAWASVNGAGYLAGAIQAAPSQMGGPEWDPFLRRRVQPATALGNEMEPGLGLGRKVDPPRTRELAAAVRRAGEPEVLQDLAQRVGSGGIGRTAMHSGNPVMDRSIRDP
jgi:hypothetical protein